MKNLKNFLKKRKISKMKFATFGAGCFWGVQHIFQKLKGVINTEVGYMGGDFDNPGYEDVCTGKTGHAEVVQIEYDSSEISYEMLLDYFWRLHDPTTLNQQGPDIGTQYRSIIFYYDEEQRELATNSKEIFNENNIFEAEAVTEIVPAAEFYRAEEYHQNFIQRTGRNSCHYLRKEL